MADEKRGRLGGRKKKREAWWEQEKRGSKIRGRLPVSKKISGRNTRGRLGGRKKKVGARQGGGWVGGRRETEPPVQVEAGASGRSNLGEEVWVVTTDREPLKGEHTTAQKRRIRNKYLCYRK